MVKRKPEILAPAGDFERLTAAIRYGADAVYLGGRQFGMRASPANFSDEELARAVAFCHDRGKRVYLTCNTTPRNDEIKSLPDFMRQAGSLGVDALIIADIGVLMMAVEAVPGMELHVSTQAGVTNYETARRLYELGAKRVVLARELSLEEIKEIREKTPAGLEIEAFVHGAMCMSFSGRCLLSGYLLGRDANRGECAQPCRWKYALMEEKRPGEYFPICEENSGSYILNARDLCMIEHLDKLAEAGITSFKIEGRAKSAYYVSVITNAYRMALDSYWASPEHFELEEWLRAETERVSHRAYDTGFFFGQPGQYSGGDGYMRGWDIVAVVEGWLAGRLYLSQRNLLLEGDSIEVLQPGAKPFPLVITDMRDADDAFLTRANQPMQMLSVTCRQLCEPGSILRKARG